MPKETPTPRDCTCGCGEQTKGGLFRMGHDARWVSQQIAESMSPSPQMSVEERRARIAAISDKLAIKFDKGREKASLRAAQEAAAPKRRRTPKEPGELDGEAKRRAADERVTSLMNKIAESYWAGMEGTLRVQGTDVPAKVLRHEDGMIWVRLFFGPGKTQDVGPVEKSKFRKNSHRTEASA